MSLKEIFYYTWESTFKNRIVLWFLGSIVAFTTLFILFIRDSFALSVFQSLLWAILADLSVIILFLIFGLTVTLYRASQIEKNNHYGNIIIVLKDFFSKIQLIRQVNEIEPAVLMPALESVCNDLKNCFDKKTKSRCCISIKLFEEISDDGNMSNDGLVYNLCRDKSAKPYRDTEVYRKTDHTVFKNMPYLDITRRLLDTNSPLPFYLNNDIPKSIKQDNYFNSSTSLHANNNLPYKSEIVVPIIPQNRDYRPALLGFLCVDSNKKNRFGVKYDVPMLQGIAEGVYDVILKIKFPNKP